MTKKDYAMIAATLCHNGYQLHRTAWLSDEQAEKIHDLYVSSIADLLEADNHRFNRAVFVKACDIGQPS